MDFEAISIPYLKAFGHRGLSFQFVVRACFQLLFLICLHRNLDIRGSPIEVFVWKVLHQSTFHRDRLFMEFGVDFDRCLEAVFLFFPALDAGLETNGFPLE